MKKNERGFKILETKSANLLLSFDGKQKASVKDRVGCDHFKVIISRGIAGDLKFSHVSISGSVGYETT